MLSWTNVAFLWFLGSVFISAIQSLVVSFDLDVRFCSSQSKNFCCGPFDVSAILGSVHFSQKLLSVGHLMSAPFQVLFISVKKSLVVSFDLDFSFCSFLSKNLCCGPFYVSALLGSVLFIQKLFAVGHHFFCVSRVFSWVFSPFWRDRTSPRVDETTKKNCGNSGPTPVRAAAAGLQGCSRTQKMADRNCSLETGRFLHRGLKTCWQRFGPFLNDLQKLQSGIRPVSSLWVQNPGWHRFGHSLDDL